MRYLLAIGILFFARGSLEASADSPASSYVMPLGAGEDDQIGGSFSLLQKQASVQRQNKDIIADRQSENGLRQKSAHQQKQHVAEEIDVVKEGTSMFARLYKLQGISGVIAAQAAPRKGGEDLSCSGGLWINLCPPLPTFGPWSPGNFCWDPYQQLLVKAMLSAIVAKNLWQYFTLGSGEKLQDVTTTVSQVARQPEWDFFRFVLEIFVVAAHLISSTPSTIHAFARPVRMPMFIFIAGVFGRSVKYDSVANMVCYTAVCALIAGVWKGMLGDHSGIPVWFLWAVFIYRLTITPGFYIMRKFKDNLLTGSVAVAVVFYLSRLGFEVQRARGYVGAYLPLEFFYLAPFFALGLLATPPQWIQIFDNRAFVASSTLSSLAYGATFYVYPRLWKHTFFSSHKASEKVGHDFMEGVPPALAQIIVVVSLFSWMTLLCRAVQTFTPQAFQLTIGWGRRTLYVYVIHTTIIRCLELDGLEFLPSTVHNHPLTYFFVSLIVNAILGSEATKSMFKWAVEPYWARQVVEQVFNSFQHRDKSAANDEPGVK